MYVQIRLKDHVILAGLGLTMKEEMGHIYKVIDEEDPWVDLVDSILTYDAEFGHMALALSEQQALPKEQANWLDTHPLIGYWYYSWDRDGEDPVQQEGEVDKPEASPNFYPLTKEEIATLLQSAQTGTFEERNRVQRRLVQGIVGQTSPQPYDGGLVHNATMRLGFLFVQFVRGRYPLPISVLADELYTIMHGTIPNQDGKDCLEQSVQLRIDPTNESYANQVLWDFAGYFVSLTMKTPQGAQKFYELLTQEIIEIDVD